MIYVRCSSAAKGNANDQIRIPLLYILATEKTRLRKKNYNHHPSTLGQNKRGKEKSRSLPRARPFPISPESVLPCKWCMTMGLKPFNMAAKPRIPSTLKARLRCVRVSWGVSSQWKILDRAFIQLRAGGQIRSQHLHIKNLLAMTDSRLTTRAAARIGSNVQGPGVEVLCGPLCVCVCVVFHIAASLRFAWLVYNIPMSVRDWVWNWVKWKWRSFDEPIPLLSLIETGVAAPW